MSRPGEESYPVAKLFLVRHGETELNSAERYWGHSDVKLSSLGLWQAERLYHRLKSEKVNAVYASDLRRALATAETIVRGCRLDIVICPELREINFGRVEGLTFAEISQLFPEFAARWRRRDVSLEFPGGESFSGLNKRVSSFTDRLKEHTPAEGVLVVAHAGVLRTLICQLMGIAPCCVYQFRLDLASLSIVDTYPTGAVLSRLNDVSHLS